MKRLLEQVEHELLPHLAVTSSDPEEAVRVLSVPEPWQLVGTGNYAAVLSHADYPEHVIKVYADGRSGAVEEAEVYRRLGRHSGFSECSGSTNRFLILKKLDGATFYDCLRRGVRIPEQAIADIDEALHYARNQGLNPHDVHVKNVMLVEGRGVVADVSDFLKADHCRMWDDFKQVYERMYKPWMLSSPVPLSQSVLEALRKGYRAIRKHRERQATLVYEQEGTET